jgi:hypothetical protein
MFCDGSHLIFQLLGVRGKHIHAATMEPVGDQHFSKQKQLNAK